jgi:hypothetical protein
MKELLSRMSNLGFEISNDVFFIPHPSAFIPALNSLTNARGLFMLGAFVPRGSGKLPSTRFRISVHRRVMSKAEGARAGAPERLNYFNYFTEIEETFVRRRGKHLLLSPLDWDLMQTW